MVRIRLLVAALAIGTLALAVAPAGGGTQCVATDMPGLVAAWRRSSAERTPPVLPLGGDPARQVGSAAQAAAWDDFVRVASAILGPGPADRDGVVAGIGDALSRGGPLPLSCSSSQRGRDRAAWQLISAGYSGAEIADILSGRVLKRDIDAARRLLLTGYGAARASEFLEAAIARRERELLARAEAQRAKPGRRAQRPAPSPGLFAGWPRAPRPSSGTTVLADPSAGPTSLSNAIGRFSALYGVDPIIVDAMISTESGGDPQAVSPRGAVGLMQLMPATARMLGVDPRDPIDNLRGGIAYFAALLRQYGDVPSALVAYNAGPTHLERVRRGEAVLYGETRRYLDRITDLTSGVRSESGTLISSSGVRSKTGSF